MKSFRDFEIRTEKLANTVELGDAFEILVEAYLYLDQVMDAKDVWVVGSIPPGIRKALNLPNDSKGIDGVYEDAAGNYIPYQVKYRTDMDTLPYGEISAFLGITEKSLQDRVIFTNARKLSADVANRTGIRSVRADKFHDLTEADFNRIHAWLTDKRVEPFKRWDPLPHQKEAIEKITAGLRQADRTTAVMACGTGKTLVALWAAEAQEPKTVLVLVPSLALLSQTLPDWCKQNSWGERFRYLCVCSDASVDRPAKDLDAYTLQQTDLEFSVTTDPKVVKGFLAGKKAGVNVIFSTYQSAEVVADGLNGQTVDLGIFDEAHKTTGPTDGIFAFGLNDKNIRIKKRLFLTATPRHYNLNKRDKDGDFQTVSMSDETIYGNVSYRLSFSAAVAADIIVPYKVIISVSVNKEVDAELLKRGSTIVRRDELQAKWVANQIALKRAIEKTGATKIITFHSQVNLAKDFAGDNARGFKEHVKGFDVFHVNGSQNAADRKALLEGFKAAQKGLITNARCLTEGVDVPSVDMVAFVDPRKSKIDIAQATGRAMRQSKATNKQQGYIVVPLFIEQQNGETEAQALARTGFEEVAMVLGAMLENDDDLVDIIRELQEAKGRGDQFNPRRLHEKVEVLGPAINLEELKRSIDVEIVARLGMGWDFWFGLLERFHTREGHCRVTQIHKENGLNLGRWAGHQRSKVKTLSPRQIESLNQLGFSWDPLAEAWETNFAALQRFHARERHSRVSNNHLETQLNLGTWVSNQRGRREQLLPEQVQRLNQLGFIWDPLAEAWETNFAALQRFHAREGHSRVPRALLFEGLKLGVWVSRQRLIKNQLTREQLTKLESIGFSWDPLTDRWEEAIASLNSFHSREGHFLVPKDHKENEFKLGNWVNNTRSNKERLKPDQIRRLDSMGFCWDPLAQQWEKAFNALLKFRDREGHLRVSEAQVEDGVQIGVWATQQRKRKGRTLTPDQIQRLDSIGYSWDPLAEAWEKAFAALQSFHKREGHLTLPDNLIENGVRLKIWAVRQRQNKDLLTPNQIQRLDAIGFGWAPNTERWEKAFAILQHFYNREGHCRVSHATVENGFNLGFWVAGQRLKKTQRSADQIRRLDSLGFNWDPRSDQWEEAFAALEDFHKQEGHCSVAETFVTKKFNLGLWVSRQREKKDQLTVEQIRRLDELHFSWDPHSENWEIGFSALKEFHERNGHCRVSHAAVENGFKLGFWVAGQRLRKAQRSADQIRRLDSLGFCWDLLSEQWEEAFAALDKYRKREGHCLVTKNHIENDLNLGSWVANLRVRRAKISEDRVRRLDALGFVWRKR